MIKQLNLGATTRQARLFVWAGAALVLSLMIAAALLQLWPAGVNPVLRMVLPESATAPELGEAPKAEILALRELPYDEARRINAEQPFTSAPNPAAPPFKFLGAAVDLAKAEDCLASAVYYEAGDDPIGQRAVAQVVLNRVRHPAFPKTVCGVVFQGFERATGCQFTFSCDGALARIPSSSAWGRARGVAAAALTGSVDGSVGEATHYHTDWVVPYWSGEMDKLAEVHSHLFFRWVGPWGRQGAWRKLKHEMKEPTMPLIARISPAHAGASENELALLGRTELSADLGQVEGSLGNRSGGDGLAASRSFMVDGNSARSASASGKSFVIELAEGQYPGSYAMSALKLCQGKPVCVVMGWLPDSGTPNALPKSGNEADRLAFYYYHQDGAGADTIYWDCKVFQRPDPSQCLPANLARLDSSLSMVGD